MEKWLDDIFPLLSVEHDCILSKQGDGTIGYEVTLPEIFTMSEQDYEGLHQQIVKAIKVLPAGTVVHKQDWFIQERYRVVGTEAKTFLSASSDRFFDGRAYLGHRCYLYLTRRSPGRRAVSSLTSTLLKQRLVAQESLNPAHWQDFLDVCGQFARILTEGAVIKLRRLVEADLLSTRRQAGVIEQYCYLTEDINRPVIREVNFEDGIRIGEQYGQLFTLADVQDLPGTCSPQRAADAYSTDKTKLPLSFAASLGSMLPCNHLYNQFILVEDGPAVLKKLESKRLRLQSLAAYSRENAIAQEATHAFLNEAISQQRQPVKAHFNLLVWSDSRLAMKELRNQVSAALAQLDCVPKQEVDGAAQLHWAAMPGNAADLPLNETFDTFAEQATCFWNLESGYRSAAGAATIRFGDRLAGRPIEVDIFHAPLKAGLITSRGTFVCGSSGGGKSMLCNHIFRSLYDQGGHIVVVDIGNSYQGLCELVGGYYFTYTEANPIRFNPFYLGKDVVLDTEKKESLKALLVTLWKQEHEEFNRSEYVALSNALQGFYSHLAAAPDVFPCFNSFYEYLESVFVETLRKEKVKEKDFDITNFLFVLKPYYRGGEFDYLLNATENLDLLTERFVVFELDNIKEHGILLPVVSLIITEMVISKMRKIPGVLKAFAIEEAWKPMTQRGMANFMKYAYKTFRKLHGIPIVVTQEVDDIISSPIIKEAIIGNSDIKILMDMRKFVNKFDALQATLGLSEKAKAILFSVNRANESGRKYREFFLDLGGQQQKVYRFEPSPEEYYTYTTDQSEKLLVHQYAAKFGGFEQGVAALVKDHSSTPKTSTI
jgi:conjugation system TraG family ATPase